MGKILLFLRKIKNEIISLYQSSQIPHGKYGEIRGGNSRFEGSITFGDYVTIGVNSFFYH